MPGIETVAGYGSEAWLEATFRAVADDPWGHDWRAYERKRYEFVLQVIRREVVGESSKPLLESCLDIGCSTGHFSKRLTEFFQSVVALDVSHTAVERARLKYPGIDFRCGALPDLNLPAGTFKLITCLEMLYYLDRSLLPHAMEELSRVLQPGGSVLFSSLAGKAPYFSRPELLDLISRTFQVQWYGTFGSRVYSSVIQRPSAYYNRLQKLESVLLSFRLETQPGQSPPPHWGRLRRSSLALLQHAARVPGCGAVIPGMVRLLRRAIRSALSWSWPVRLASGFTRLFNLQGTHTVILATKRASQS